MNRTNVIGLSLLLPLALLGVEGRAQERVEVGRFSEGDLGGWKVRRFEGETSYTFDEVAGRRALRAKSDGTASGLYRKIEVDLERTPYLEWSWRIAGVLKGVDERTKNGDDYPARVYVIVSGGLAFWRTRSLVYVWSSNQPKGSTWDNAFTDNAKVIALESGDADAGRWIREKRDVRADFRRLFGDDVDTLDAVAIMTDTDNSGQSATAWYGDISFVSE
jgi:hypothetical protein